MTSHKKLTIVPSQNPTKQPKYHNRVYSSTVMSTELAKKLQDLRITGDLCDVAISSEASMYKSDAHRLVLALKSPYFNKLFTMDKDVKEFKFSKAFDLESIECIIKYLYDKELEITTDNVDNFLRISVLLELQEVLEACCQFITRILSISNFSRYLALDNELQTDWLADKIFKFLEWNFYDLTSTKEFVRLKSTQFHRLVCGKGVRVEGEETLYNAIMKWYEHKPASRKSTLQNILQSVQFIRMSPKFLQDIKPQLVDSLGLCKDKIKSAQALQTESPEQLDIWANDRREHIRDVIYLFSSGSNEVDRFDEVQNTFVPCPQLKIPRKEGGEVRYAVRVEKYLFLVSSRSVLRWNQFTFDWEYFGEGTTIKDAGVCGGMDSIFVVGGREGTAVKSFNVNERTWSNLPPMSTGRRGPGVVSHSNALYVLGGFSIEQGQALSEVESLSLETGEWTTLPSMRIPRCRLCCVIWEDKIFAMGGRDNVTSYVTVETFDLKTNTWDAPKEHMNYAREDFCATVHEGKIVCLGGRRLQSVEWFDPNSTGKWAEIGTTGENDKIKTGLSCVAYSPPFEDSTTLLTEF